MVVEDPAADPDPAVVVDDELLVTVVVVVKVFGEPVVVVEELEEPVELADVGLTLPPVRSSPSVSSCDWNCLLIQLCTSVWFS